jgi:hypothetical protein
MPDMAKDGSEAAVRRVPVRPRSLPDAQHSPTERALGRAPADPFDRATSASWRRYVVGGREFENLIGGVRDALGIFPPDYVSSFLGPPWRWARPTPWYSEYRILLPPWRPVRALTYLADIVVPSVPREPSVFLPPPVQRLFWHPSRVLQRPDHIGSYTSHLDETWFFVNGILTNGAVAQVNAAYLAYLFHRPITLIQNSTGGAVEDLLECALDKAWGFTAEAARKAFQPIHDALKDPTKRRVVLVAHSQGTIIAGVLLRFMRLLLDVGEVTARALDGRAGPAEPVDVPLDGMPLDPLDFAPLSAAEVGKLEVYCFANCATSMRYLAQRVDGPVPWIESFGNQFDIVARLGVLAPQPTKRGVEIDGPRYESKGAWGHLFNEYYLAGIEREQKKGRRPGPRTQTAAPFTLINHTEFPAATVPRLYQYLNGGCPESARPPNRATNAPSDEVPEHRP